MTTDGFERIRVLWPDHLGLARGKYLPAAAGPAGATTRVARHCTGTWALGFDRQMTPGAEGSGFFAGLPDMEARFDMAAVRPGWEPRTGVVVADLCDSAGAPVLVSPRAALRRAVDAWGGLGYAPEVGVELEAYLMEPVPGGGGWRPVHTPGAYVYGTGPAVDPHGVVEELWDAAAAAGIEVEAINSEYEQSQFEFTLGHAPALEAADRAFLFKLMARELAARRGLLWTFVGKPVTDRGGSGLHVNLSLCRLEVAGGTGSAPTGAGGGAGSGSGSAGLAASGGIGANAFDDPAGEGGLSDLARRCVAGLLAHHRGLAGVCAPTVNAYRRLRPAQMSGYWANWGWDHRGVTVRIPPERGAGTRLEHRLSDGAAPVHTAVAAVLQAARLGLVDEPVLPPAETGDGWESVNTDVHVPADLGAALDALEADGALCEALGKELVLQQVAIKRTEWDRYCATTTDWELAEYLPFL